MVEAARAVGARPMSRGSASRRPAWSTRRHHAVRPEPFLARRAAGRRMWGRHSGCPPSRTTMPTRRPGASTATAPAGVETPADGQRRHRASGAASCSTGVVYRGANGFAAEIGHVVVEPSGPPCGCGNRGCWEQVASGSAITRLGTRAAARHPHSSLLELAGGDPWCGDGRHGDRGRAPRATPSAEASSSRWATGSGWASPGSSTCSTPTSWSSAAASRKPATCFSRRPETRSDARSRALHHRPEVPIVQAALGSDSGAIGAAALVFEQVDGDVREAGRLASGVHRRPCEAAGGRDPGAGARRRRRLRARPPVPSGVLPADRATIGRRSRSSRCCRPWLRESRGCTSAPSSPGCRCELPASWRSRRRPSTRCRTVARSSASAPAIVPRPTSTNGSDSRTRRRPSDSAALEETAEALHALFGGRTWPGGAHVPAHPGSAAAAGRARDLGRGPVRCRCSRWRHGSPTRGTDGGSTSRLSPRGRSPARARRRKAVPPTWAGIALVGEDRADLDRLLAQRAERDLPLDGVWTGTAGDGAGSPRAARGGRDLVRGAARRSPRSPRRHRGRHAPMSSAELNAPS